MKIDTIKNIPQWAISYIVYLDDSGLDEADKKMVDDFVIALANDGWTLEYPINGTENTFCRFPAFGDACATVDFEIYHD